MSLIYENEGKRRILALTRLCFFISRLVTARKTTEDEQRGINRAGPLRETGRVVCLLNLTEQATARNHTMTRVYSRVGLFIHVTPPGTGALEVEAR